MPSPPLVSMLALACAPTPALLPRSAIFADPDKSQIQLSSDGAWIAYRSADRLWLAPTHAPSEATPAEGTDGVLDYRWTWQPGSLVYAAPVDDGVHLFLLDAARRTSRDLTPTAGLIARIERLSTDRPDEILVRIQEPGGASFDFHRLDLPTGDRALVLTDPPFDRVLFDDAWRPRVATRGRPEVGGYELLVASEAEDPTWTPLASFAYGLEEDVSQPIAVDKAGNTLYLVDSRGRDTAALKAIDLATGQETVLAEDRFADVLPALVVHPTTGRVQSAVSYFGRQRRHILDPSILDDHEYLRSVDRGDLGFVSPGGRSLDDRTWLLAFMDGGPTRYWVYDRDARQASFLFSESSALDGRSLARRHLEVVTTRDGLDLPADLYLPTGTDADGNGRPSRSLPMVVYVHGGSWGIYPWNSWLTNRSLQLLADRGYAVLRVEFRGAGGFGRKVHEAGLREWGGAMQDDLVDAADWAVAQGITTPDRIGIFGWSYGGYAALSALATSDRFACGLAMYAPTDLEAFVAQGPPEALTAWRHYIGDDTTETGRALLRQRSPIRHVETFDRPVLLVQGGKDEIVPQDQADRFVEAMRQHGKPVTYLLYPDEPHDLRRAESWESVFAVTERFFHEHLGGSYQPLGDELTVGVEVRAGADRVPGLAGALVPS